MKVKEIRMSELGTQLHRTFLALHIQPVANALPAARSWQEQHPG